MNVRETANVRGFYGQCLENVRFVQRSFVERVYSPNIPNIFTRQAELDGRGKLSRGKGKGTRATGKLEAGQTKFQKSWQTLIVKN